MKAFQIFIIPLFFSFSLAAQNWQLHPDQYIYWDISKESLPYSDNIEMAGRKVAGIIDYQLDTASYVKVNRKIIYPQLHPYIKDTDPDWKVYRAYLTEDYADDIIPTIIVNQKRLTLPKVDRIEINGTLKIIHETNQAGLKIEREFFPSMERRQFVEKWTITNLSNNPIEMECLPSSNTKGSMGDKGRFESHLWAYMPYKEKLQPGEQNELHIKMYASLITDQLKFTEEENSLEQRLKYLKEVSESLQLETPIKSLNTLFKFSKIRAAESIFDSQLGLIHSPGGGRYYVGIWANDQAEYINPFFPYLGYDKGNKSAMNCYRAFAGEMNDEYKNIRYAFEIEGLVKPFLLDRGDAAMIAYGASQYALASGNKKEAKEIWPLIEWCLEYCDRQLNEEGVVLSESDEMEGRIETGIANLSTSSLYYGALNHAVDLSKALKLDTQKTAGYQKQATDLAEAIENYFGAKVEGLETYKYYKEHDKLRHWICLPLVVGIHDRKEATNQALFDRLWTENGVMVEKNSDNPRISNIFWDRGTLYALRGALIAGEKSKSIERLIEFSEKRLLGDRVPYVVEAFPEGSMAHLSAESALYCRVFIEGLFGIYPTGFNRFKMTPQLPVGWDEMALRRVKAFGQDFDVEVERVKKGIRIKVYNHATQKRVEKTIIQEGGSLEIKF